MPLLPPATAIAAPATRPLNAACASHAALPLCHSSAGMPVQASAADGAGHRNRWLRRLGRSLAWLALWLGLLLGMLAPGLSQAQDMLPVPALTARVIDQTGTLSEADKAALEAKLAAYERDKGSQIVVLMVPTTRPEDIASYAHRIASSWKIGRRDVGDGVLLIVAKDDRRMRIEVAKKLEGALPDLAVARILDQTMKPQFRKGNYAGGISAALDQITRVIDGEELPPAQTSTRKRQRPEWEGSVISLVFFTSLLSAAFLHKLVEHMRNKPKKHMILTLGSSVTSAFVGGMTWLLASIWLPTAVAAVVTFTITYLIAGLENKDEGRRRSRVVVGGSYGDWGRNSSWGGGFGGDSSSGFSSGGGGDFGGGGASGDW